MLKQTEHGAEPSALRSTPAGFRHSDNLTFTSGPDRGFRKIDGGLCPALTPVTLLVMALITASGHGGFFFSVRMCYYRHDCVQPILTDKTNVWLELWGQDGCWIALLSILNDSW